ncbi:MAG: hypothetical protein ABJQ85_15515 [Rhizobiaceae bacterium]
MVDIPVAADIALDQALFGMRYGLGTFRFLFVVGLGNAGRKRQNSAGQKPTDATNGHVETISAETNDQAMVLLMSSQLTQLISVSM